MTNKKKNTEWEIKDTASINVFINAVLPSFMTYKIENEYKTINISRVKVEENDNQIVIYVDKNKVKNQYIHYRYE